MSTDTMFMDNLDEFVNDENKVVTYKWLSQTLQVHVNQAKQMLYAFVQDQRNKKDNDSIHVTYFVAGMVKSLTGQDKSLKCAVVPEEELEAFKASMDPVTSCHIFSVQKVQLKDSSPLYITDYSALRENVYETNKFSSISFTKAKPRSKEQLEKLGEKSHTKKEPASSSVKTSAAPSSSSSSSHGSKTAPKGGIANLFANLGASKKDEGSKTEAASAATHAAVTKETSKSHTGASGPKSKKAAGGVMSFFSNHTGRANKPAEKTSPPVEKKSVEPSTSSAKQKAPVSKKTEVKKPSRTHKLSDSDEESKSQKKKRRRIQTISDSSSSSEEEMEIEESPVPSPAPSPPPPVLEAEEAVATAIKEEPKEPAEEEDEDVIPSTPQNGVKHKHVRRRKLVPKTYMDKDGFMVTEKVMESESASEVEEEPRPTSPAKPAAAAAQKTNQNASRKDPPPKKASPKKKTTPTAGNKKQMSLTSFFSKK